MAPTQIGQIAGVLGLAAEKGDVQALLSLCDRYERLQSVRGQQYYYTGSFYFQGPTAAVEPVHDQRAGSKAYDDVLTILDHELAAARRRLERQSPGSARMRIAGQTGMSYYYQTMAGGRLRAGPVYVPGAE